MMGKKKNSKNFFKESIDPRFNGFFKPHETEIGNEQFTNDSHPSMNMEVDYNYSKVNENTGFQNFISNKLASFLDEHIKEVDRPVSEDDFFANKNEGIRLFSNSDVIKEETLGELVQHKPVKKKRKKDRSGEESFKEVAVSYEWIQNQARLLKS